MRSILGLCFWAGWRQPARCSCPTKARRGATENTRLRNPRSDPSFPSPFKLWVSQDGATDQGNPNGLRFAPVSYTHLTLPTKA